MVNRRFTNAAIRLRKAGRDRGDEEGRPATAGPFRPFARTPVDGAEATDAEIAAMERVWVLFDGNDTARLQAARVQWKTVTTAGHPAQYWSEETGRWEKKAESPPRQA